MSDRPTSVVASATLSKDAAISDDGNGGSASATSPPGSDDGSRDRGELVVARQARQTGFLSRFRYPIFAAGENTKGIEHTPLIDGHNDLPWQLRVELHNRIYDGQVDLSKRLLGHTDLLRMREGQMGGQFWSVYVQCDAIQNHYDDPSRVVRDTLEQIDVTKRFIAEHPNDLQFCDTPTCVPSAFKAGRIASMLGIEGAHQVGSSIASIRQMFDLGVRYITLTHNCDNAFATAASTVAAGGEDHGLTQLGYAAVREMNRLGMMIDLSHVSHQTMRDVLSVSKAPVIFSHSGAYSIEKHLRNVPDDVLRAVKRNGGIVMAVFAGMFLNGKDPQAATIHDVVDHVLHIVDVCGWECIGVGSDYSGTPHVAIGLEDVSKIPNLLQLVMEKGAATDEQMSLFAGENLLRAWAEIEQTAREAQAAGEQPVEEEAEERHWPVGAANRPWMLRGSREKAMAQGM